MKESMSTPNGTDIVSVLMVKISLSVKLIPVKNM